MVGRLRAGVWSSAPAPLLATLLALVVAGCSASPEPGPPGPPGPPVAQPSAQAPSKSSESRESGPRVLVEGLEVPWGIAFLPGGDALVTERDSARMFQITPTGTASEAGVIEGVSAAGEGGLLGVAVSPKYDTDRFVFVYFTAEDDNRVVRYRYERTLTDPVPIITGIPKGGNHNGGRLEFGPDGFLYASTGEVGDTDLAQDRASLGGKILRATIDGDPAPGNPFGTLVWSYGHRNVQGMAWDDEGRMYATEFGQNHLDELNLIEKGRNYGWPEVEGTGGGDGFTDPLVTWTTDEASPSGLAYANGSLWAAGLRGRRLWRIPLTADGSTGTPVGLLRDFGRLRAVTAAPAGGLWVSTSNRDGRGTPSSEDDRILVVPAE